MADINGDQTHPLEPVRPSVPEHQQPRSSESHPAQVPDTAGHVAAHEHSDVNIRAIAAFIVTLFVIGIVVHIFLWGLIGFYGQRSSAADPAVSPLATPAGTPPPEPRLLTDEPGALRQLHQEEEPLLKDIRRAKDAVVGKLPARPEAVAPAKTRAQSASRMDTSSGRKQ